MLDHNKLQVTLRPAFKFYCLLENCLPTEEREWMEAEQVTAMFFEPCKCREARITELQGFLDHMKAKQEECIFQRILHLWHYVLGGGCTVLQHGPTNWVQN